MTARAGRWRRPGTPILLVAAWRESGRTVPRATRRDLTVMAGLGVMIVVTNLLYLVAVDRAGVAPASVVTLLEALVATVLAWWLFGQQLGWLGLMVGAVPCGSIALLSSAEPASPAAGEG